MADASQQEDLSTVDRDSIVDGVLHEMKRIGVLKNCQTMTR